MKPDDLKSVIALYSIPAYAQTTDIVSMPLFIAKLLDIAYKNNYQFFDNIELIELISVFFTNTDSAKDPIQRRMMSSILMNTPQSKANEPLLKALEKLITVKPGLFVIQFNMLGIKIFNCKTLLDLTENDHIINLNETTYSMDLVEALFACPRLAFCIAVLSDKRHFDFFSTRPPYIFSSQPTNQDCNSGCIIL